MEPFLTSDVLSLLAVCQKDASALPLLADALQEAGFVDHVAVGQTARTVLETLRAGEHAAIFTRYLTADERAGLLADRIDARGMVLDTLHGFTVYNRAQHVAAGADRPRCNPRGHKGEPVMLFGTGWAFELEYPAPESAATN